MPSMTPGQWGRLIGIGVAVIVAVAAVFGVDVQIISF